MRTISALLLFLVIGLTQAASAETVVSCKATTAADVLHCYEIAYGNTQAVAGLLADDFVLQYLEGSVAGSLPSDSKRDDFLASIAKVAKTGADLSFAVNGEFEVRSVPEEPGEFVCEDVVYTTTIAASETNVFEVDGKADIHVRRISDDDGTYFQMTRWFVKKKDS